MRARNEGLDIYLDDIVPTQEVDTLVDFHLQPVGFDGGYVLDARYPTSESIYTIPLDFFRNHSI